MSEELEPPIAAEDAAAYEQRLLAAVRASLPPYSDRPVAGLGGQSVVFDEVAVAGEFPDSVLVVYVRDPSRSECVFGFRLPVWNQDGRPALEDDWPTPEGHAWILGIHLEEDVEAAGHGLPAECTPGEVTWVR